MLGDVSSLTGCVLKTSLFLWWASVVLLSALPLSSVAASLLSPCRSCCWGLSCPRYLQRAPGSCVSPSFFSLEGDRRAQPSLCSFDPSPCCSGTRDNELEESLVGKGGGEAAGAVPGVSSENNKTQRGRGDLPSSWLPLTSCLNVWCSSVPNPAWLGEQ